MKREALHSFTKRFLLLLACTASTSLVAQEPLPAALESPNFSVSDPIAVDLSLGDGIADFIGERYWQSIAKLTNVADDNAVASYYRGLSRLALDQPEKAVEQLETVVAQSDYPDEADLDLAVAYIAANRESDAIGRLELYLAKNPDHAVANLFMGVARHRTGDTDRARESLQIATQLDPQLQQFGQPYLQPRTASIPSDLGWSSDYDHNDYENYNRCKSRCRCNNQPDERRWYNLTMLVGYEYDSNLTLSPSFSGLGENVAREASRTTLALLGDVRLLETDQFVIGVLGSGYASFNYSQDTNDFNLQDYTIGAYENHLIGRFLGGVRWEYHDTSLQGTQFGNEHRLVANLSLLEGDFGHSTTYYEFDYLDVQIAPLIAAQDRSGPVNAVGFTQAIYLAEGLGRVFLGYRYENANADGTDFERSTNQVSASLEHPICDGLMMNMGSRIFWDDYKHANSLDFFDRTRDDNRSEARVGLQKFFSNCISGRIDYTFTNSTSNVANLFDVGFYDYDRHLISTQLIIDL